MKRILILICLAILFVPGCLYVAPIDEEEDYLPYINVNAVNPTPGALEVDLSSNSVLNVTLSDYGDDNQGQVLYHRVIIDFRPAGESRIIATEPRFADSERRDRIMYQFRPCTMSENYSEVMKEGKTIDIYLLLSDGRFIMDMEATIGKEGEFLQPFKTNPDNRAVWVQWSVIFHGACSEGSRQE